MATIPSDPIPAPGSAHQVETRTKSPREGRAGGRPHERLTEDRAGRLPPKALMAVEWLCAILNPVPRLVVDLQVQSAAAHLSWAAVRRAKLQAGIVARRRGGRWYWERRAVAARPAVDLRLGLTQRPVGRMGDFRVGTVVQLASGAWVRIVATGACTVTIHEPGRGTREVAPGTEVFAVEAPGA